MTKNMQDTGITNLFSLSERVWDLEENNMTDTS